MPSHRFGYMGHVIEMGIIAIRLFSVSKKIICPEPEADRRCAGGRRAPTKFQAPPPKDKYSIFNIFYFWKFSGFLFLLLTELLQCCREYTFPVEKNQLTRFIYINRVNWFFSTGKVYSRQHCNNSVNNKNKNPENFQK